MKAEEKGNKFKDNKVKVVLFLLLGLLAIAIIAVSIMFVNEKMKQKNYTEAITSAEKSLAENHFEEAVIQYKKAISINPEDTEGYVGLANLYVEQNQISKAKSILKRGYIKTKSPKIKLLYERLLENRILSEDNVVKEEKTTVVDLETASQNIGWNTSFLQKIAGFNYEDYRDEYGNVENVEKDQDGFLEVVHSDFEGVCYYRNTLENKNVIDASRNIPKATGMPEKITLHSLEWLFRNFEGGVSLQRFQMLIGERVVPKSFDGRLALEAKTEECIIRIETDSEGNIVSPNAWNEIILLNANKQEQKEGAISGVVMDAVTGEGVEGAELTFEPSEKKNKSQTVKTNASGVFHVELKPDTYTIQIEAKNYITEELEFTVEEGKTYNGEQFVISPKLAEGTARIVLEWNAEPQDLDSYLSGETDAGDDVFVSYRSKQVKKGGNTIAELDLDDTNGYGPETTTIHDLNGVYRFRVADYRRTGTMKQYGATVKVYLPGKQPETITIKPGADVKDIWIVCEIDHGELKIINDAPAEDEFTRGNK